MVVILMMMGVVVAVAVVCIVLLQNYLNLLFEPAFLFAIKTTTKTDWKTYLLPTPLSKPNLTSFSKPTKNLLAYHSLLPTLLENLLVYLSFF